ncbi:MFS transporter [Pseudomonas sp. BIGb0427]|uniref:MFS transporter n=1 Tax=unclassified Pseudomonas TaxID=196821 RepID=UPI0018A79B10|nr:MULTISPECIES: MFS transporter [unclassified Pseudomonas]QPG62426.1 MFS transporter [Pseudomonas sp. BIGb0427]UVM64771.1 MFS transporter [Pseudomonas sp. B21-009]
MQPQHRMSSAVILLFSVACALAVGNVYYAQPLLEAMAREFAIDPGLVGLVVTLTQVGYGLGLLLLVPLGDRLNRRRLIVGQSLLSALALVLIAWAPSTPWLLLGMGLTGLLAVVTQVLVAYAATLSAASERGHVVGVITSGIVIGILLARTLSGAMADLAGWRSIYWLSAALTLVIAALLWRVLPRQQPVQAAGSYRELLHSLALLLRDEPLLRRRSVLALLSFASAMVLWTPLVLPLSAPPLSLSTSEVGLFGLAGAAGALAAARAGALVDRGLGQWVSGGSLLLMLASWAAIALTEYSLWALLLGVVVFDLGLQAVHVASQSLIYRLPEATHSRLTAAYMLFYSVGSAFGALTSTLAYAWGGWLLVCAYGALLNAVALGYWWLSEGARAQNCTSSITLSR